MKKRLFLSLLVALVFGATANAQTSYTWTGATDSVWTTPGNWSGGTGASYPQGSDSATINSGGTATAANGVLSNANTIITINDGGKLTCYDIRATTTVNTGGTLTINGGHCQQGKITVDGGTINNADHYVLGATMILNSGTDNTTGNLNLGYKSAGTYTQNGGTVSIAKMTNIGFDAQGTYTLNGGTLNINGGGETKEGSSFLFNGGTVNINGGTFTQRTVNTDRFRIGNGAGLTGTLNINAGATFTYTPGSDLMLGANGGTGNIVVNGGTLNVPSANFVAGGSAANSDNATSGTGKLTVKSGTANLLWFSSAQFTSGAVGDLEVNGGTVNVANGLRVAQNGTGTLTMNGGTINIAGGGASSVGGTGKFYFDAGTLNLNGGTFTQSALNRGNRFFVGYGSGNEATLNIAKGATFTYDRGDDMTVGTNNGTGTLVVNGTFNAAGCNFVLGGGAWSDTNVKGQGNMIVNAGADVNLAWLSMTQGSNATYGGTAYLEVNGGTVDVKNGIRIAMEGGTSEVVINGGVVTATGDPGTINNVGGVLTVNGGVWNTSALNNQGVFVYDSGVVNAQTFTNSGTITLKGNATFDLSGMSFTNSGAVTLDIAGPLAAGSQFVVASVQNEAAATSLINSITTTGWTFLAQETGGTYSVIARYGSDPVEGMKIWINGSSGSMADSSKWSNYSESAIGYVVGGTNTFSGSGGNVVIKAGANTFAGGFVVAGSDVITIAGGSNTFAGVMNVGNGAGSNATVNITDGFVFANGSDWNIGLSGAQGTVNQSGGVVSVAQWFNIGERGTGIYNLTGGTLTTQGNFIVGRRGPGSLSVADGATLTANGTTYVGYFPGMSGDSTLSVTGGTVLLNALYLGGNPDNGWEGGASAGTSKLLISGGQTTINGAAYVSYNGPSNQGAKAALEISDGTVNFKNKVQIGNGAKTNGTLTISGGTVNFNLSSQPVLVGGDGGTGLLDISGGNVTIVTAGSTLNVFNGGTLKISGTANVSHTGNDFNVGSGGTTALVEQSGGSMTANNWLNIGEGGTGTYNLSGGTLTTKANLAVGRRGSGFLTISGTGNLVAQDVIVGMFCSSVPEAELKVTGGTASMNNLFLGNHSGYDIVANPDATYLFTVEGGEVNVNKVAYIAHTGKSGTGANALMSVSGGTVNFKDSVQVGSGAKTNGSLDVSGGRVNFNANPQIAPGSESVGTMNLSGDGVVYLNCNDIYVGNGGTGTIRQIGGTLWTRDSTWINIGESTSGVGYYYMSGGEIKCDTASGANYLVVGRFGQGHMTVSGDSKITARSFVMAFNNDSKNAGSSFTLVGSKATINAETLTFNSNGTANALFGDMLYDEATKSFKTGISTINVSGTATINSNVKIDSSNYYYDGLAFAQGALPDQILLKAGTLAIGGSVEFAVTGPWTVSQAELANGLVKLVNTSIPTMDLAESSIVSATGERGLVEIVGDPNQQYSTQFYYSGIESEKLTDMIDWLNESAVTGETFSLLGDTVLVSGLSLDENGLGVLSWNFAAFNAEHDSALRIGNVPEPATWSLLLIGLAGVWYIRRRR